MEAKLLKDSQWEGRFLAVDKIDFLAEKNQARNWKKYDAVYN